MTARVVVGMLLVLVLGGLVDTLGPAERAGQGEGPVEPLTVRSQVQAQTNDSGIGVLTLSQLSDLLPEHYGKYRALRDQALGATMYVDGGTFDQVMLLTLSGASAVVPTDLSGLNIAIPHSSVIDVDHRGESWAVIVDAGTSNVLITRIDGVSLAIDARRIDGAVTRIEALPQLGPRAIPVGRGASLLRGIGVDTLIMALLMLVGGSLLPASLGLIAPRWAAGLLVGIALQASVGLFLLPGAWSMALTAALGIGVAGLLRHHRPDSGWQPSDRRATIAAAGALIAVVTMSRTFGAIFLTPDSFDYLARGRLLASGALHASLIDLKRGVALPSIHAPGFALGAEGVQSLGPVILLAILGLLTNVARQAAGGGPRRWVIPVLTVLAVVASPQLRTMAGYINSHLFVGAVLLLIVLMLVQWQMADDANVRGWLVAGSILLASLIHLRVEGIALVLLLLIITLRDPEVRRASRTLWWAAGLAGLAWAARLASGGVTEGLRPSTALTGLALASVALFVAPLLAAHLPQRLLAHADHLAVAILWVAAVGIVVTGGADRFVAAAVTNLLDGYGGWGVVGALLIGVALVGVLLPFDVSPTIRRPGRVLLLGFVPITLLAKAGDGLTGGGAGLSTFLEAGGRVGWGDSANRMWMHAVPVVLALILLSLVGERTGMQALPHGGTVGLRRTALRALAQVSVVVAVGLIGIRWDPHLVPSLSRPDELGVRTALVVEVPGREPLGEMVPGTSVTQRIRVGPAAVPQAVRDGSGVLCVAPYVATYERQNDGALEVNVQASGGVEFDGRLDASRLTDWSWPSVCAPTGSSSRLLDPSGALDLLVTVRGVESGPGSAVTLLGGALIEDGRPDAAILVGLAGGGIDERSLALRVEVARRNPASVAIDATARALPLALAILVGLSGRSGVRRHARSATASPSGSAQDG